MTTERDYRTPPSEAEAASLAASHELHELALAEQERVPGLAYAAAVRRVAAREPGLMQAYGGDDAALAKFRARGRTADLVDHGGRLVELRQKVEREPVEVTGGRLVGLELLRVGVWNGVKVSEADLHEIVRNAAELGFQPALKLGHDNTPAAAAHGWIGNLRVVATDRGPVLVGDVEAVPPDTMAAIKARRFDAVSAELWLDLSRNGKRYRIALKGAALLGAHPPAVSDLRRPSEIAA